MYVGALNENGVIEIKTVKIGSDTVLGKIIGTVREAQENKGDTQRIADTFAKYFLPVILVICAVVGIVTRDLMRVMTILVIACPCALVLATPTAVIASVGNAAKRGIILKGGSAIERCAEITAVCLDKTGTLTKGRPRVVSFVSWGYEQETLQALGIAEKNSQHPIAGAVRDYLTTVKRRICPGLPTANSNCFLAGGVRVSLPGAVYEVSNRKVLDDCDPDGGKAEEFLDREEKLGRTAMLIVCGRRILGGISVADTLRESVPETIQALRKMGIGRIVMLTGITKPLPEKYAVRLASQNIMQAFCPMRSCNTWRNFKNRERKWQWSETELMTLRRLHLPMWALQWELPEQMWR